MKLLTQGLIVICMPLIFQFLLSTCLVIWIFRAQEDVTSSAMSSGLVRQCDLLSSDLYRTLGETFVSFDGMAARSNMQNKMFADRLNEVHKELSNIPAYKVYDQNLWRIGNELIEILHDQETIRQDRLQQPDITPKILSLSTQLTEVVTKIVASENAQHDKSTNRNNIIQIVIIATICSIAGTIAFATLCALNTRKLIELISANAKRFSHRQPLAEPLAGDDDLARVDQIFHVMDQAIREAEQREHAIIDNSANLICSLTSEGAFLKVNPFAKRLLGFPPEKLARLSLMDVVPPEEALKADELLTESCKVEGSRTFELKLLTNDKKIVETSWSSFWSESDQSLFCVVSDITEQKKVEHLKEDFIAMISDELRSPLLAVSTTVSQTIEGKMGLIPEAAQAVFLTVTRSLDRLIRLVSDLLDFEKLQSGQMPFDIKPTSLSNIIKQAEQEVLAHAAKCNVRLKTAECSTIVLVDGERITQLLVNLLSNAIRYCKPEGLVTIVTAEHSDCIEVSVIDQGPGIPPDYVEKVFAAFEVAPKSKQTKEGGTGLGLAISRLIVEGHHGTIYATNEAAGGARFTFTLPYAKK